MIGVLVIDASIRRYIEWYETLRHLNEAIIACR